MPKPLWRFIDDQGTFVSEAADQLNTLYFPLCNWSPILSCVTPDLHGDLKTSNNTFLLEPVSRIDLSNSKSSRNFWLYVNPAPARRGWVWSATGVSKDMALKKSDKLKLEAGLLWHKITRSNRKIGLEAEITSFVPAGTDPVEIMQVKITNISKNTLKFTPTTSIPIYSRSADNLRDHRHVTSLLNRIRLDKYGVIVKPTLLFDETGHKPNRTRYFILGVDQAGRQPEFIYPTQEEFCGDGSDLEAPRAVYENQMPEKNFSSQGKEAIGALRFGQKTLKPKASFSYIILLGITDKNREIRALFTKFNSLTKIEKALEKTKEFWQKKAGEIALDTGDQQLDNWVRWVSVQPFLRKIFGCSFLPDFDYGKGGRGWRDLWQDCLSLILTNPKETRSLLVGNFRGVRIDGSNATIIGQKPGEFLADRNRICRVWMDHAAWPLLTTHLYIQQTGDLKILLEKTSYFRDHQFFRGRKIHPADNPQGKYRGSVLEHLLIQNLVQFFNVGEHNCLRLENADWNDGLDMAYEFGESVAFSSLYAQNLNTLCELLGKLKIQNITLLKEITLLLDTLSSQPLNYNDPWKKQKLLERYFSSVQPKASGKTVNIPKEKLIQDLQRKADWLAGHLRKNEWLKEGFFNGYYDNAKKRLEGKINGRIQMTLTGQVFPVMSGVATEKQIKILFRQAQKYLRKPGLGFCLNTDFKTEQHNLGSAFSFTYGDKENGAFFNHMSIMFSYALYKSGFAREGFEVLDSVISMANNSTRSKTYPCLPEYFNLRGCGMYSYLTGSASWFMLTLLTQVFGIRGQYGDLVIAPKLTAKQFNNGCLSLEASFAGRPLEVRFLNPRKKDFGKYNIKKVIFNAKTVAQNIDSPEFFLNRTKFLSLTHPVRNLITVILG